MVRSIRKPVKRNKTQTFDCYFFSPTYMNVSIQTSMQHKILVIICTRGKYNKCISVFFPDVQLVIKEKNWVTEKDRSLFPHLKRHFFFLFSNNQICWTTFFIFFSVYVGNPSYKLPCNAEYQGNVLNYVIL